MDNIHYNMHHDDIKNKNMNMYYVYILNKYIFYKYYKYEASHFRIRQVRCSIDYIDSSNIIFIPILFLNRLLSSIQI